MMLQAYNNNYNKNVKIKKIEGKKLIIKYDEKKIICHKISIK